MGLLDAVSSTTLTPYHSGLPINAIPPIDMSKSEQEPLLTAYHQFLGMLNWLSISMHPNLTTAYSLLAIATAALTQGHLDAIQYVGHYIKAAQDPMTTLKASSHSAYLTTILLLLSQQPSNANWGPQDASIPSPKNIQPVSINETRSILGHIIFLSGGPLIWKCNKETHISCSSCKAEIKATVECAKNVQWMRNLLDDLDLLPPSPTPIYNNNQAAIIWCNTSSTKGMHHYNISENDVQEAINEHKEVSIHHISGKINPADLLTKEHKSPDVFRLRTNADVVAVITRIR